MANTLLLDISTWDLCVDSFGNIAVAQEPYALAQDAASQCRLFLNELWYDTTQGVPYFQEILGQMPPLALLRAHYRAAALLVPGVQSASVFIANIDRTRVLTGQVQIKGPGGQVLSVADFASFLMGVSVSP
jgi:hypothetical protein